MPLTGFNFASNALITIRINELKKKITELKEKIQKARLLISDYGGSRAAILSMGHMLDSQYSVYQTTAAAAFQTNIFEGTAADSLPDEIQYSLEMVLFTQETIEAIGTQISCQIEKLEEYIVEQEKKLSVYQEELQALQQSLQQG